MRTKRRPRLAHANLSCRSRGGRKRTILRTYSDLVEAYILEYRQRAEEELDFYRNQRSLRAAVNMAALCTTKDATKHPHQWRLRNQVLNEASSILSGSLPEIRRCKEFDALMKLVEEKLMHLHGLGELTKYDIAHRVGNYFDLQPAKVYLHRGTRDGAKALGFDKRLASIDVSMLPRAFLRLKPYEIEDCLCIYKSELSRLACGNSAHVKDSKAFCAPAQP